MGTVKPPVRVEAPFVLSEMLPVVSAKLVRHILRAEYVDMAELFKDNMEAELQRVGPPSRGARCLTS